MPAEDKITLSFAPPKTCKFEFNDQDILVKPSLSISDRIAIINEYIDYLYAEDGGSLAERYLIAEYAIVAHILETNTNIGMDENLNLDGVLDSSLWDEVTSRIPAYPRLRSELGRVLELHQTGQALEHSVGTVLENLSDKLIGVMDKVTALDVDGLQKVSQEFAAKLDELNQAVPGIAGKPATRKKAKKAE